MIKSIRLFVNHNDESLALGKIVKESFIKEGFTISDNNYDLGIAIGGDGSFLRMVKATKYDSNPYYVGINTGTLGFLQEVKKDEVDKLIEEIKEEKYKIDEIGIQETRIKHKNGINDYCSLNEIVIRDEKLKVLRASIFINNDLLEVFNGDGILIASSQGSTAHNLSYGGAIVPGVFSTLQITPMGPINSKAYQTLTNSVIVPSNVEVIVKPETRTKNVMVSVDGDNPVYEEVESINTSIKDKKIKCLRFSHYNFPQKINEKLLSTKN
jgi:NAD+ kinase